MKQPAAVLSNKHMCPMVTPGTPPAPHVNGGIIIIILGCPNVFINNLPAARVGDKLICSGPPPHQDTIVKGSSNVLIDKKPAARLGDTTSMGGMIVQGCATVIISG
ncbi:PAAR motif [Cardinium endosymbiont of Sogatella furcifera]|uniref:PAAR domain-containing protein n=1 Tax=Cardinium endosymbiont of Sogatella furcifera TaxID=650378 RepID=UPI000E0D20B9|nr:PAAR domain-containing protein [Cardinium endosymbiont of Sogatella furcifera]AXI24339.1 PAAR motif [Cardinium endosymbiont of Sogatella furcifera]